MQFTIIPNDIEVPAFNDILDNIADDEMCYRQPIPHSDDIQECIAVHNNNDELVGGYLPVRTQENTANLYAFQKAGHKLHTGHAIGFLYSSLFAQPPAGPGLKSVTIPVASTDMNSVAALRNIGFSETIVPARFGTTTNEHLFTLTASIWHNVLAYKYLGTNAKQKKRIAKLERWIATNHPDACTKLNINTKRYEKEN